MQYSKSGEVVKGLRRLVDEILGGGFDIKVFHTKILENGSIPLIPLQNTIENWINSKTD